MVHNSPDQSTSGVAKGQGSQLSGGVIASLTGVGLLLIFMIQNTESVTLNFLFWSFTWPLWLFSVLMALPLESLFQVGFIVALGLLVDTFLVRALLVPSVALLLGERNWWPQRLT